MASSIQILRSTTAKERPFPGSLLEGQPAVNVNATEPGLFFKASDGTLFKIGPAAITTDGAPPNTGGVGQLGNCVGELWLDKSLNPPVLKVYDGTNWIDAGSGGGGGGTGTFVRWIYTAVGGETTLSGSSGGVNLEYEPGLEEVFVNGVLISRGTDYVATSGTSITGLTPLSAGDIVTVVSDIPLATVLIPGPATLLRWFIQASSGQTVLSGFDSSSQVLAYTPGLEEVYINGVLLVRNTDYTANDGTSITLTAPLTAGDFVNVLAFSSSGTTPLPPPTPVSALRWYQAATAGQTVLSGPDDDGQILEYTPGLEEVFVNGAFLRRGSDYVAANGTTISLSSPLALNDEITVLAFSAFQGVSISSAEIQDGAITENKLATNSVSTTKLQDDSVTADKLAQSAIVATREFVNIRDYGATGLITYDATIAFNAALADMAAGNVVSKTLYLPAGTYSFKTAPSDITTQVNIIGDGLATIVRRDFTPASASAGVFNFRGGSAGSTVSNMGIYSVQGLAGGCLISMVGTQAAGSPDGMTFEKLWLSTNNGSNNHDWAIYFDGSLRTSPIGVRDTFIRGCSIFGGASGAIYAKTVVALHMTDVSCFQAGGTTGRIFISGLPANKSYYVTYTGGFCDGLGIEECNFGSFRAANWSGNITNASSAVNIVVEGCNFSGTVQNFWTGSRAINIATGAIL